jgi:hypothetical protein
MDKIEHIREILIGQGPKIVCVDWVKKDGTPRRSLIQTRAGELRVLGEAASEQAQRAAATRRNNHPHLFNTFDLDRGTFRSIDLRTVTRVQGDGQTLYQEEVA